MSITVVAAADIQPRVLDGAGVVAFFRDDPGLEDVGPALVLPHYCDDDALVIPGSPAELAALHRRIGAELSLPPDDPCPTLVIPDLAWEPAGSDTDPASRLVTTVVIAGLHMHLEAYAVHADPAGGQAVDDSDQDELLADLYSMVDPGDPFQTTVLDVIEGRRYVLVAFPHS